MNSISWGSPLFPEEACYHGTQKNQATSTVAGARGKGFFAGAEGQRALPARETTILARVMIKTGQKKPGRRPFLKERWPDAFQPG
jgi:hypothetical protein